MSAPADRFRVLAACSGLIAVGCGAFGAHALRARLEPRLLEVFETAARYQMYHALALLLVAAWLASHAVDTAAGVAGSREVRRRLLTFGGWAFVVGTILFSGSLYVMALTGVRALGAITPIGGVAFLLGWGSLALAARRG
jgi:uncharacterized membrane protein YgdD (TMEM256/DUF423 family)